MEEGQGRGGGARGQARRATSRVPDHPTWSCRRGPQARVQQHTVVQLADVFSMVQILDFPVPQTVEQRSDFLKLLDTQRLTETKSVESGRKVSAELGGHVSSSTLSAHQMARVGESLDSVEWVQLGGLLLAQGHSCQ